MTATAAAKTAQDHVDDLIEDPTLDRWFDRNPAGLSDEDLLELIQIERRKRAEFINVEASK